MSVATMQDVWPELLVFGAVVVGLASLHSLLADLWLRDRERVCRRVDEEFLLRQREKARTTSPFRDLDRLVSEVAASECPAPTFRARVALLLERAGLSIAPVVLLYAMLVGAAALGLAGGLLVRSVWAALPGVLLGGAAPVWFVLWRRQERMARLTAQLPDALENMARVLRAGQTLSQALQSVVRDFDQPLAGEMAYCYEQQHLGLAPAASYQDLARRVDLLELRIFALGMNVQQQAGGNIAELLDKLAAGARERLRGRLRLRALTAEGRLQANILLGLPIVVFAILWLTKRAYIERLLDHPGLLLATVVAQFVGALWIRSIAQAEE